MKRLRLILLGLALLLAASATAQRDFRSGYVIREKGDTLWGKIDYRGDVIMGNRCRFLPNGSESYVDYTPMDIYGYRFTDGKFFISKEVEGGRYFLEFLVGGKVNFYHLRVGKEDDRYYIENDSLGIRGLPYEEGVRNLDGKDYLYTSKRHIWLLKSYMKDAPSLSSRIDRIGKVRAENLVALNQEYHRLTCDGEQCIVYQKKLPSVRVVLEPLVGFSKYNWSSSASGIENKYLSGGIMAHIWMPSENEKLYVRMGLRYTELNITDEAKGYLRSKGFDLTKSRLIMPLQLEYTYPKGQIRPKAALGLNVYDLMDYITPSVMAGVNVNLTKRMGISLSYDLDFIHSEGSLFGLKRVLSNTFTAGVMVELGK